MEKCEHCQSEKVITDLQISDLGMNSSDEKMQIILQTNPYGFWNKGNKHHPVSSTICCSCGKIQLHLKDPESLWNDYQLMKQAEE